MRCVIAAAVLAVMAVPAVGQARGQRGPERDRGVVALTPQEIEAGWISLFDGGTSYGWAPQGDAKWTVGNGVLQAVEGGLGVIATTVPFADFELRVDCWVDEAANASVMFRAPLSGAITPDNAYAVKVRDSHPQWPTGSIMGIARATVRRPTVGRWATVTVRAEGTRAVVQVDGRNASQMTDRRLASGRIALQYGGAGTVRFRNIQLRPLGTKSIFNGKDLSEWAVVPGHPSVYSVTREGWLNVKGGNGDIQTTGAYGNFVLQLGIISNGDRLNSGVFFRAIKGEFWSGYEAQIRNQWQGDDRSQPVDFGTGGIYNRQPARRVVSSDREWFTMTVIAHGLRMATWVNGEQVTDLQDTRPVDESNARRGARSAAGVITLQGHDPTTDLSFRSIRVAEIPPVDANRLPAR